MARSADAFPSKYLKSSEVKARPIVATISRVVQEVVGQYLVQYLVFHVLGHLRFEQLQAEPVDGTDIHFCEAGYLAECLAATNVDAVLKFGGRLVGESKGDDIRGRTAAPALL